MSENDEATPDTNETTPNTNERPIGTTVKNCTFRNDVNFSEDFTEVSLEIIKGLRDITKVYDKVSNILTYSSVKIEPFMIFKNNEGE